jgi:uncharacterized protein YkwD
MNLPSRFAMVLCGLATLGGTWTPALPSHADQQMVRAAGEPVVIAQRRRRRPQPPAPSSNPPSNSPSNPQAEAMAQEMVSAHNQWRSRVGVPPLKWSNQLSTYAQEWANHLSQTRQFEHRTNSPYGENLYWSKGQARSPQAVVNSWASEIKNYRYETNQCQGVCGHYTQIVWRNTTEFGCAMARDRGEEVWVCNYNPPGNFVGQKPY